MRSDKKKQKSFMVWLETVREKDDELFELIQKSTETVQRGIMGSDFENSLLALHVLMWHINTIKLAIFDECENDSLYVVKILYRTLMEHWLKSNYIFARLTKEKTDSVGEEYKLFGTLDEDMKYGNSVKWLMEIRGAEKSSQDPWDILLEHRPALKQYSKEEVKQKAKQFNYREIVGYLLKNTAYSKNSFVELIVPEYSELSSYVHAGPRSIDYVLNLALTGERFTEYKGMARFTYNLHKTNVLTSYMAFAQFVNKDLFPVVESMRALDWIE